MLDAVTEWVDRTRDVVDEDREEYQPGNRGDIYLRGAADVLTGLLEELRGEADDVDTVAVCSDCGNVAGTTGPLPQAGGSCPFCAGEWELYHRFTGDLETVEVDP